jgi:hypothetical protein
MKKIILFTFFLFLCKSCKNDISVVNSFDFNTGVADLHFRDIGLYEQNNTEYLYSVDRNKDEIKIFDLQGNKIDSVSLKKSSYYLAKKQDKMRSLQFINEDSILIMSSYRNHLVLINRNGKIINTVALDSIMPDSTKCLNDFFLSVLPAQIRDSRNLIFYVHPRDSIAWRKGYRPPNFNFYYDYYENFYNTPVFVKFKDIFEQKQYCYSKNDYYRNFNNDIFKIETGSRYKIIDKNIFDIRQEIPVIAQFSTDNLELEKIIEIKKEHSKIFTVQDVFGDSKTQKKYQKYIKYIKLNFSILNIFFNKQEKKYYVLVEHNIKKEEELKKGRIFSVIIYDKNFENPKEYVFPADVYKYMNAIMTSKGLLIQRKEQNLTPENYGTQTFDLLRFD